MFCQKCGTKNPENGRFCRSCGTDLAVLPEQKGVALKSSEYYLDRKGRIKSNDPDELWSVGVRSTIMGIGFLVLALVLLLSNVAGGRAWWWTMLIPSFSMLSIGIGNLSKSKRLEKRNPASAEQLQPTLFAEPPTKASLPPHRQNYAEPQSTVYDTGELVAPPSIIEGTTRHLEINKEGETMTLPKKNI